MNFFLTMSLSQKLFTLCQSCFIFFPPTSTFFEFFKILEQELFTVFSPKKANFDKYWMELEIVILSEVSQTEKDIPYM